MKLWIATLSAMCAAACIQAETNNLKVVEEKGHLSPVAIKVTSLSGQTRSLMLIGIGSTIRDEYLTHQLTVRTDGGASSRTLWLDAIGAIRGTSSLRRLGDEFTIVLKDGREVSAMFAAWHDGIGGCSGEPTNEGFTCNVLFVRNEDDGVEKIELRKVKAVDFIGPVRQDKAGNAMYEPWRYSPFTGEKLP